MSLANYAKSPGNNEAKAAACAQLMFSMAEWE
jgi:hypothetical protein